MTGRRRVASVVAATAVIVGSGLRQRARADEDRGGFIVRGSALAACTFGQHAGLAPFGTGFGVTIGGAGGGAGLGGALDALQLLVVDGDGGRQLTGATHLVFAAPARWPLAPFGGIGAALSWTRLARPGGGPSPGQLSVGPTAELGVHGFVGDHLYWRLSMNAIGAGAGLVAAELSAGWVL